LPGIRRLNPLFGGLMMSKFAQAAKLFMEKQEKLQDKTRAEAELTRLLKQMYDFGRASEVSKKK
jgi:hypothetical protein